MPVYSTRVQTKEDSVLTWFLEKYPEAKTVGDPDRPGIVHRLDKQTSGLLILAKTAAGFEFLKDLFHSRNISKEYQALVYGRIEKHGMIDKPLSKIGHEGQSRVRVDKKGRASKTEYWPLKYFTLPQPLPSQPTREASAGTAREGNSSPLPGSPESVLAFGVGLRGEDKGGGVDPVRNSPPQRPSGRASAGAISNGVDEFTLVRVKLHSGRTHQIRVHMTSEKHSVMGDDLYGKPESQKLSAILGRQFLHASKLEFKLPDGTWIEISSDLPEDLKKVLMNLENGI